MKKVFKFFMYTAMAVAVVASCTKEDAPAGENKPGDEQTPGEEQKPDAKPKPELKEESLNATPTGDTLTFEVKAEGAWTIAADECDWATVEPATGTGDATVTFYVTENKSGKDRSVSFFVTAEETETTAAGEIYDILLAQVKMEYAVADKDMAFLQWMVDNKVWGDATPTPDWFNFSPEGYTGLSFGQDAAGKWFVQQIYYFANGDNPSTNLFNAFPPTLDLPNLERIYINLTADGTDAATAPEWCVCPFRGTELPTEWNCPMLWGVHLECTGMTGVIPASFAALPSLTVIFFRNNDFYGALPQNWASKYERITLSFNGSSMDSPNLGYLVPAKLDIMLNSEKPDSPRETDQNMIQICHSKNLANWKGYENGWGQVRYVKFGGGAEGDLTTWNAARKPTPGTDEENAAGGLRNPKGTDNMWWIDSWGGWWHCCTDGVPTEMFEWNDADAAAWTAEAAGRERRF